MSSVLLSHAANVEHDPGALQCTWKREKWKSGEFQCGIENIACTFFHRGRRPKVETRYDIA